MDLVKKIMKALIPVTVAYAFVLGLLGLSLALTMTMSAAMSEGYFVSTAITASLAVIGIRSYFDALPIICQKIRKVL